MKFLLRAVAAAAVILLALKLFAAPMLRPPHPREAEIAAFTREIAPIQASEVRALLQEGDGSPRLVFVYASWCGYCKQFMPVLAEAIRGGRLAGFQLLFLSSDRNFHALSELLVAGGYRGLFTPYVVKQSSVNTLQKALAGFGMHYEEVIPYFALLDSEGKLLHQVTGVIGKEEFLTLVEEARNKQ